jgi:hypothetical protein
MPMTPKGYVKPSLSFDFEASLQDTLAKAAAKADKKNLMQAPREPIDDDGEPSVTHNTSVKRYRVHARKPAVELTESKFPEMPLGQSKPKSPALMSLARWRNDPFAGKRRQIIDYMLEHPHETPGQVAKALGMSPPYVRTVLLRAKHRRQST